MSEYCNDSFNMTESEDSFRMWQGLVGPYYTPHIDEHGNLYWTNNGDLPNPETVQLLSGGIHPIGIVANAGDLPSSANQGDAYIVGTSYPFYIYFYDSGVWKNIGYANGPKGDPPTAEEISSATNTWLTAHITNPSSPPLDRSLSSSASAAPADMVGDLKSAISENSKIVGAIYIRDIDWIDGEYIDDSDGSFKTDDTTYKRTGYIECIPGEKIRFGNTDIHQYYGSIYNAWYDSNKNFISNIMLTRGGEIVIKSPINARYFALSCKKTINEYAQYESEISIKEDVDNIKQKTVDIGIANNLVDFDNIEWVDGVYINEYTGEEVAYSTWKATDYIEIDSSNEYAMLYEHDDGTLGTFNGLVYYAWYDSAKNYVAGGKTQSVLTNSSNRAKYLRVSMGKAQSKNLVLNYSDIIAQMSGQSSDIIIPYGHIKLYNEVVTKELDERLSAIENGETQYKLPSSWESKLETLRLAKGNKFVFGVQTDTHYTIVNDGIDMGNDIKQITKTVGVDFIANLGDIIRGYATVNVDDPTHARESYTEIMKRYVNGVCCPFLFAVGNHDKGTMWAESAGDPSLIFSLGEIYSRAIALSKNTLKNESFDGRSLYYFVDFEDSGIRVIVLNTTDASGYDNFNISQKQCDWFSNTALNTSHSVIVMGHSPLEGTWGTMLFNAVTNGDVIMAALRSFKSNGGEVIGCFWGHTHVQVSETVNGILHVAFTYRDTAEFVMIDKDNKSISTIGFGGATDRTFTWT